MNRFFLILMLPLLVNSCGERDQSAAEDETDPLEEESPEILTGSDATPQSEEVTFKLYTVGDNMETMQFEPQRLEASPGAEIHLILMNKAKDEAMIHNAVFIYAGNQESVSEAALAAGPDREYIPEYADIIAATELAEPGETVELRFKAPDKTGTYQYICTYPGHTQMKGVLLVK